MCGCSGGNRNVTGSQSRARVISAGIRTQNAVPQAVSPLQLQALKAQQSQDPNIINLTVNVKGLSKDRRELERRRRAEIARRVLGR